MTRCAAAFLILLAVGFTNPRALAAAMPQSPAMPRAWTALTSDTTTRPAAPLVRYPARPDLPRPVITLPASGSRKSASRGMLYGGVIGGGVGAIIGALLTDPDQRGWFTGREYGALGGGLAGAIAGIVVGGLIEALRQ